MQHSRQANYVTLPFNAREVSFALQSIFNQQTPSVSSQHTNPCPDGPHIALSRLCFLNARRYLMFIFWCAKLQDAILLRMKLLYNKWQQCTYFSFLISMLLTRILGTCKRNQVKWKNVARNLTSTCGNSAQRHTVADEPSAVLLIRAGALFTFRPAQIFLISTGRSWHSRFVNISSQLLQPCVNLHVECTTLARTHTQSHRQRYRALHVIIFWSVPDFSLVHGHHSLWSPTSQKEPI